MMENQEMKKCQEFDLPAESFVEKTYSQYIYIFQRNKQLSPKVL